MKRTFILSLILQISLILSAKEYHVSVGGNDTNSGTSDKPLRTIASAAILAEPGDIITVHSGTYREWIKPPKGGLSDKERIVFRASPGEEVSIKGSELITSWVRVNGEVWKVTIPDTFFGNYNPYQDTINGDWFHRLGRYHHTGEVYLNGKSLYEVETLDKVIHPAPLRDALDQPGSTYTWYCERNEKTTTIWANFHGSNPKSELVEINARPACFYPEKSGINYITVRGFHFSQAATQWAAPTAEQIGLIGTNWSKGWIIEDNIISDSKCSGVTLGKDRSTGHNVWSADMGKDGALHFIEVIFKALNIGWDKENIGSHIVRNNVIYNCEQTGICGSLGAVFSTISGNHIYNIWIKRQFEGVELGGIKIHGAIDMLIKNNRIHNCLRGIWLDWMAQGTRISGNLLYNNNDDDIFLEVDHGPLLVDNNIILSRLAINNWSEGVVFVHNLIGGKIFLRDGVNRFTPYHFPHSTHILGYTNTLLGDDQYFNNIFTLNEAESIQNNKRGQYGPREYSKAKYPVRMGSNIYFNGIKPYMNEVNSLQDSVSDPNVKVDIKGEEVYLQISVSESIGNMQTQLITTSFLGKAKIPDVPFENADGTPLILDTDYAGNHRSETSPFVGPFENLKMGRQTIRVW
jgi:hypothetical protein